jgi:hypothetical protein
MGRHSAPDDDGAADADRVAAPHESDAPGGRHSHADSGSPDEQGTQSIAVVETDTQADLRILRHSAAVRVRCIAAVLASFLAYTLIMIMIGRMESYLYWIWIPVVTSGVLAGAVLDRAHRRATRP